MCKFSEMDITIGESWTFVPNWKFNCRPGQRGTTGQLIFKKCDDPPSNCECEIEPPKPSKHWWLILDNIQNSYPFNTNQICIYSRASQANPTQSDVGVCEQWCFRLAHKSSWYRSLDYNQRWINTWSAIFYMYTVSNLSLNKCTNIVLHFLICGLQLLLHVNYN